MSDVAQVPASLESERNILGSIFLAPGDAIAHVCDFLKPSHFYGEKNARVYRAALTLFERNEPIDYVSVSNELSRSTGKIEVPNLSEMLEMTPTPYHIMHHAREVVRLANCRKGIQLAGAMTQRFYEKPENIEAAIGQMATDLLSIIDRARRNSPAVGDILEELKGRDRSRIARLEMRTLNTYTCGVEPGHLWVIGGFSSTGKTAFALQMLRDLAEKGRKIGYFSLEMTRQQLMLRLLASVSGLPIWRVDQDTASHTDPEHDELAAAEQRLYEWRDQVWIYDDVYELPEIGYLCRRHKIQTGLDVVFIDFLQNLRGGSDEYERLSDGIKVIQQLAQHLDCTIVVLSQISNEQAAAGMGTSDAYSFKGAGTIRDAADKAIILTRDRQAEASRDEGKLRVIVKKNRQGPIGECTLRFQFSTGRIWEDAPGQRAGGLPYADD